MARSKKPSGETGLPIIIALVFFILLSIGLGVMYYLGLEQVSAAKKAADDATAKEKTATELKNEYEIRLEVNRMFLGTSTEEGKAKVTGQTGTLAEKARDEQTKLLTAVNSKLTSVATTLAIDNFKPEDLYSWNWPQGGQLPGQPTPAPLIDRFGSVVASKDKAYRETNIQTLNAQAEATKLKEEQKRTTEQATATKKELDGKIEELGNALKGLLISKDETIKKFEAETEVHRKEARQKGNLTDELQAKLNDAQRDIDGTRQRLRQLEEIRDQLNESKRGVFAVNLPHGEIVSRKDKIVEINLGSADNLKPGQTFKVQPASTKTEGLASRKVTKYDEYNNLVVSDEEASKGSIEVIEVLGANLSSARITEEPSPIRESIFRGDLLYNPLWKKGVADHVVLAGIFDLDADGGDDIVSVVKSLNRRGVIVDAYLDLSTRKWVSPDPKNRKPGPTQTTTYIVRGWLPEASQNDPLIAAKSELIKSIETAISDSKLKGAQEIRAVKFFSQIGDKVSPNISENTVNIAATKFLKDIAAPMAPVDDGK